MTPEQIDQLPAGPELDVLVAQKVMGFEIMRSGLETKDPFPTYRHRHPKREWDWMEMPVPEFSSDMAAAWLVIDKIKALTRPYSNLYMRIPSKTGCDIWEENFMTKEADLTVSADTVPLAICRIGLKLVMRGDHDKRTD